MKKLTLLLLICHAGNSSPTSLLAHSGGKLGSAITKESLCHKNSMQLICC